MSDAEKPPSSRRTTRRLLLLLGLGIVLGIIASGGIRQPTGPASGTQLSGNSSAPASQPSSLRIATFNIHSAVGADGKKDLQRVASELKGFHLVGLNELRGGFSTNQAAQLGESNHMSSLFAPVERQWWHDSFGNGLLTNLPLSHWQRIPLPSSAGRGMRNVIFCRAPIGRNTLNVLITHIDRQDDRHEQLRTAIQLFLSLSPPAILMGDMNTTADDPLIQQLLARGDVLDPVGEKISQPSPKRIDWIFTRGLRTIDAGLIDKGASDHPLLWAEVAP